MKKFRERNLKLIALVTAVVLAVGVGISLSFNKLPVFNSSDTYYANFSDASGLATNDIVTIAGVKVGNVTHLALKGTYVRVTFQMNSGTRVGSTTSVAAKVLTAIGQEYLAVNPKGPGRLQPGSTIPLSRTKGSLTLVGDLNTLTNENERINISQLEQALNTTTQLLQGTSPQAVQQALSGLAQLSQILAGHQQELDQLLTGTQQVASLLNAHSGQLIDLVNQSDLVLQVLNNRRQAIQSLLATTATLGNQLNQLFGPNQGQLQQLLTNLQAVSGVLAKDSNNLAAAMPLLAAFARYGANVSGSGPWLDANVPTLLLPDNVPQQCAKQPPKEFPTVQGCRQ